jgi:multicomponent Na+:H+ antiporter subunit B
MRWIYAAAIAVIFARLALLSPPPEPVTAGLAEIVAAEAGVPNSVCGILLRNRLYDTLFELFVFTVAVLGVHYAFSMHEAEDEIFYLHDPTMVILARIGAMVSALIFLELALRGHLAPGGGFAAGVAGGTAIGLLTLSGNAHELHAFYERWHVAALDARSPWVRGPLCCCSSGTEACCNIPPPAGAGVLSAVRGRTAFGGRFRGVIFLHGLLQVPQLFGDVIEPELDGVENPELEVLHLGRFVHHPDNLDGHQQYGDFKR